VILSALGLVAAASVAVIVTHRSVATTAAQMGSNGLPSHDTPLTMHAPQTAAVPAVVVDVYSPDRVRQALAQNAWIQEALKAPLGRGFLGSWSGFLQTKGSELGKAFEGTVFELFATQVFSSPFRVVWFGGDEAPVTPAFVIPNPTAGAKSAIALLNGAVQRGMVRATECPAIPGSDSRSISADIARWLIADHPVFGGELEGRLAIGRTPEAVLAGLCAKLDEMKPSTQGADVELTLKTKGLGREAELLTQLLGIGNASHLAFAVEGDRFAPKGIAADLATNVRLDGAPLSDEMLKLIPESTPVIFAMQVKLPENLTPDSLQKHFASPQPAGKLVTRQVVLLWTPHGSNGPSDTALIWSQASDQPALSKAFKGAWQSVCGRLVFASAGQLKTQIAQACAGKQPSILHAPPTVVDGFRAPSSVALGLNLGKLLSQVTSDSYVAEVGVKAKTPPEMIEAQKLLEALPFLGLRGLVKGNALVPGGFRS
jgi:hypothetical protein